MEVRFRKDEKGRVCRWTALRPPRTRVWGPSMAIGPDLPHDLATFVVEDALEIRHGFWGSVAAGATFRTLDRKRTPQGRGVIARNLTELEEAEARVNDVVFSWRRGEPTPADEALDAALEAWRALPLGGELVLTWPASTGRRPARRRPSASRRSQTAG